MKFDYQTNSNTPEEVQYTLNATTKNFVNYFKNLALYRIAGFYSEEFNLANQHKC